MNPSLHTLSYGKLRAALLSRHFALGRYFRANLLTLASHLDDPGPGLPEQRPWEIAWHDRENPLMLSGQLLACLAVEHHLGQPAAGKILRLALEAIGSLYKFQGNHFDGYVLRWDPVTTDHWGPVPWRAEASAPEYCQEFLLDRTPAYLHALPFSDPRYTPRSLERVRMSPESVDFKAARERSTMWFRQSEPSQDELVGLVAGYGMVHALVEEPALRREIERQAAALGDYLAEHSYLLVRPNGGFTLRGSAGALPALELPLRRTLERIAAKTYESRHSFEEVLAKAGVWELLRPAWTWTPTSLARAVLLLLKQEVFDVSNKQAAQEFVFAYLLHQLSPKARFRIFMTALKYARGGYSAGFPPFLAAPAFADPDPLVRKAYLAWFPKRLSFGARDQWLTDRSFGAQTCFASAVAVLLGGSYEAQLVERLDATYAKLEAGGFDLTRETDEVGRTTYVWHPALDYLSGLALAWLHARRRAQEGNPVTTPGFPQPPSAAELAAWPPPAVPASVVQDPRMRTYVPVQSIQGMDQSVVGPSGAEVFLGSTPPSKSAPPPPPPPVPLEATTVIHDRTFEVRGQDEDVPTSIVIQPGDWYEIQASGELHSGGIRTRTHGPEGLDETVYDLAFPLHGGSDPAHARRFCLLGRLLNYFFAGRQRAPEPFLYDQAVPLVLRINQRRGGDCEGKLTCRVIVRRAAGR